MMRRKSSRVFRTPWRGHFPGRSARTLPTNVPRPGVRLETGLAASFLAEQGCQVNRPSGRVLSPGQSADRHSSRISTGIATASPRVMGSSTKYTALPARLSLTCFINSRWRNRKTKVIFPGLRIWHSLPPEQNWASFAPRPGQYTPPPTQRFGILVCLAQTSKYIHAVKSPGAERLSVQQQGAFDHLTHPVSKSRMSAALSSGR